LPEKQLALLIAWSRFWARWTSALYYQAYLKTVENASFLPRNERDLQVMMDAFILRKAIYELGYELNDRPDWVKIPLQGIMEILNEPVVAKEPAIIAK